MKIKRSLIDIQAEVGKLPMKGGQVMKADEKRQAWPEV